MSKMNSRFSHLRINVGSEEIRYNTEKSKINNFRDSNSLRILSPKNSNTLTNRPVQVVHTSPMRVKNDNQKNFLVNNFTRENQSNNTNSVSKNTNSGYLNTMQNQKMDKLELSVKAGKPNLINIIKSNLRAKNQFIDNLNSNNNFNFHNLNRNGNSKNDNITNYNNNFASNNSNNLSKQRNSSNTNTPNAGYIANYPITNKSNSVADNKQYSTISNVIESSGNNIPNNSQKINSVNNIHPKLNNNKTLNLNSNVLNFNSSQKENSGYNAGYLYSEGNATTYSREKHIPGNIRQSSNNPNNKQSSSHYANHNINYIDNINKNSLENIQKNFKILNNQNLNIPRNNNNNFNNTYNPLSEKRENYLQQNFIKSERALKSLSPIVKLESAFANEQKKKLLMKNSLKVFSNGENKTNQTPTNNDRLGTDPNNLSGINNRNNSSGNNYEDRVVHTDTNAVAPQSKRINALNQLNNLVISNNNNIVNQNKIFSSVSNRVNTINNNNNINNNLNNLNNNNSNFNNLDNNNNTNNNSIYNNTNANTSSKDNGNPQLIDIMKLISANQPPISLNVLNKRFEGFENSKYSTKSLKYIKGYSANTHQGTVR